MLGTVFVLLAVASVPVGALRVVSVEANADGVESAANPVRKVVTMLQKMQVKVTAEGEAEKELYDKFMCYCKTNGGDGALGASISAAEGKIPEVDSSIREGVAKKAQLEADLKDHRASRSEGKAALAQATALREKEAKAFAAEKADYDQNIAALGKASTAVSKGMAGFLQTQTANIVRKIALSGPAMNDQDRQSLLAFLSASSGYAPRSGEIEGILKQLKDDMEASLSSATNDENSAIATYEELKAAKTKEIATLTESIEVKSKRVGELGVELAHLANDLEATQEALGEDKKFLADLNQNCATKTADWEARSATRADELVALAETIKVLNDDDALELFKKTLPSAALLQVETTAAHIKAKARAILEKARPETDFIALALSGKKIGFEKVIKMIDNLVALLKREQTEDDNKRDYCGAQLDEADDKKKGLERTIADHETGAEEAEAGIVASTADIEALSDGIAALDKSVAEATEQRKNEHAEYTQLIANDSQAKEVLAWAKNRLAKFYNPKLYKPAPKRELEEAFIQVASHRGVEAPPPPPETYGAYQNKHEESGGVVAMIDLLIKDLAKEMQEAEVEEKDAQADYEKAMADAADKRAQDTKLAAEKEAMKAQLEVNLQDHNEGKAAAGKELGATAKYIASLHGECDWLLQHFDARKDARASEVEALGNAKAVLSGADFSFVQTAGK